jgi:alcohol dehydrogenase class IV
MSDPTNLTYDFFSPQQIVFGWGRRSELGQHAKLLGNRAWLVCGSRTLQQSGIIDQILSILSAADIPAKTITTISREPEVHDVDELTKKLVASGAGPGDFLIAVGGGSAIDLAKACSAMVTNRHGNSVQDFLEGVGAGLKITQAPLPLLAMPTTAGTGTEATKNAVLSSYDPPFKKSLRSELMIPKCVLIDPELAATAPPAITAQSGMDAITQLIESFVSCRAKPIPTALCLSGLKLAVPAIETAVSDGTNRAAREAMAHAALLSGIALANSGLGFAHGVAPALGVHCKVPHGLACATLLPVAMQVNCEVAKEKFAQLEALFAESNEPTTDEEAANAFIQRIQNINTNIGIPNRLSQLGVTASQLPAIVKSSRGNSMNGNPRELTDAELHDILEAVL